MQALLDCIQPYLTAIKDIATILSLGVAAFVAIVGLRTWRRQLKGTAEYELAKRVLKSVYRLRDALAQVRSPIITSGETEFALKDAGIELKPGDPSAHATSITVVYQFRWRKVVDAFHDLEVEAVEVEALWGKRPRDLIMELRKNVNSLLAALALYLRHLRDPSAKILDPETLRTFEAIVYRMTEKEEEDRYARDLSAAISEIEQIARPYLSKLPPPNTSLS
jgi:hypothetical protein